MPPGLKGDARTNTRTDTRKSGNIATPEEQQDIKNALDGRKFLEKHSLLCPPGEPPSHETISTCLHQISAMAGLNKQAINAIRATAFLLEEIEENSIHETVRVAFDSQTTEFSADMKLLIEDVNEKISEHIKAAVIQAIQSIPLFQRPRTRSISPPPEPRNSEDKGKEKEKEIVTRTYASALINPPPYANPKLAAREGIKARQFLIQGIEETNLIQKDTQQIKAELNKTAKELGMDTGRIRSVDLQRDNGLLFEVDSDESAKWFTNIINRVEFCGRLGEHVNFRSRIYNVIAFNAPLNINPESHSHIEEINEANNVESTIVALRWAKPIERRSSSQRSAHIILSFTDPVAANRAITNGIQICNKKCRCERTKREPIRCLKCQGWNHIARDCKEVNDTCGICAGEHKSIACPQQDHAHCTSCKSRDHANWNRACPVFIKKTNEFNIRNPENLLQYFPTTEPWTWTTNSPIENGKSDTYRDNGPRNEHRQGSQQPRNRPRHEPMIYDTYIPDNRSWSELAYRSHSPNNGWGEVAPRNTQNAEKENQPRPRMTFVNNSGVAGPSNAPSN